MKKLLKKLTAVVMILTLSILSLAGCSSGSSTDPKEDSNRETTGSSGDTQSGDSGNGGWLETEIEFPDDLSISGIQRLSDGTLRIAGDSGVYDSKDNGQTWEKAMEVPQEFSNGQYILYSVDIDQDGNILYSGIHMDTGENAVFYCDKDGTAAEVPIELPDNEMLQDISSYSTSNEVQEETQETEEGSETKTDVEVDNQTISNYFTFIKLTGDKQMLGIDSAGRVYHIDLTSGEILGTYGDENMYYSSIEMLGNKLYLFTYDALECYDFSTGDYLEVDQALNDYFNSENSNDSGSFSYGSSSILTAVDEENEILYFADSNGLYRYKANDTEVEQLMSSSRGSMGDISKSLLEMELLEDQTLLIFYFKNQTSGISLMRYAYSEDIGEIGTKELSVYSLYDNQNIRQAITLFQKEHPEYNVTFEVGLTGDITLSDALRTLNNDMLSGNGPDILVTDGMPVSSYAEKGLLSDLSDLVSEVKTEGNYFENILSSGESDGNLYTIPTRFRVPIYYGEADALSSIIDLSSLAEQVEALKEEHSGMDKIFGNYSASGLVNSLLDTSLVSWLKDDGTLDEEALNTFLTEVKRIYDTQNTNGDEEEINIGSVTTTDQNPAILLESVMNAASKSMLLNTAQLESMEDLNALYSLLTKNEDWDYISGDGQAKNVFVPMDRIGINSQSENLEDSREFVKLLLSKDMQELTLSAGIPVSMDAYDTIYKNEIANAEEHSSILVVENVDEEGNSTGTEMFEIKPGTEDQYEAFKTYIQSLDTTAELNQIIRDAVLEQAEACMTGTASIQESVSNIMQTVNLYLAE